MDIIPLTLAISLCLTITFIVFFWREQSRRRFTSAESEALLPLADEEPSVGGGGGAGQPVVIDIAAARAARATRLAAGLVADGSLAPEARCHAHGLTRGQSSHGEGEGKGEKPSCRGDGSCHSCERRKGRARTP
ncbi:MAG: hypothetical protein LBK99_05510 [Opitutaceae bacterium]|jgi:hypothetical protein|nr:hypothetical protein [Opitutaceae bacterium]